MSEAKATVKPPVRSPSGWLGVIMATVMTMFFASIAAGCFMGVIFGVRSIHQHSVDAQLRQIDMLLAAHSAWLPPPAWVNDIQDIYHHWRDSAAQHSGTCFNGLSAISSSFPHFQGASTSIDHNPLARDFSQTCFAMNTQILPLLTGIVAVMVSRLWLFTIALPLLILSLGLGLIDGLVQRDIRKFQGARETTLLFHRIKRCGTAIFFIPFFLYMAWLSPVSPLWFFLPMATGLGLWLALTVRFFKKSV